MAAVSPSDVSPDLRPLPDVAMTGNCTRECTEFGHSDACWMPGQPSPNRKTKNAPKLSTFVPYQEREGQERLTGGSPKLVEERSNNKEIPLNQTSEFPSATSPTSQASKREIYL
ncbi:hypothetical protein ANANG_G00070560 [Anguilla anguilla]|uniref:Protocadherin domain-containing protein n=1 Tax=Anguilla anguilla TaxID=7936 RepID=A0A9D3MQL1_ANGAN|nr:hypothetical protein ANANG_G00070560 [Anguilla anguilla]